MSVTEHTRAHDLNWAFIGLAVVLGFPGLIIRLAGQDVGPVGNAVALGTSITAAAFLLTWAVETAEMDISQGLALAIIAFIAVLPEYSIDLVLSWRAGASPVEAARGLAIANMTGGNRLLIGVAWPLVFGLFLFRTRLRTLTVEPQRALELVFLGVATLYVVLIPLRHSLTILDSIVLVGLFLCYLFFTARVESEETELVGPAEVMGRLPTAQRRGLVGVLLLYSAFVIFASAEPFADSLIHIGQRFGVSEFLLIQWLAPLASEAPEVLVASLLAWRGRAGVAMGALISSKVNQWTLLIGTLPIAFAISAGELHIGAGLPLDGRQREEILLTAAQSAFAIAVFIDLRMSAREAVALFVLFATQLLITDEAFRMYFAGAYIALCILLLTTHPRALHRTARLGWQIARHGQSGFDAEMTEEHAGRPQQPSESR